MAWIGPQDAVLHYLAVVGADKGSDGRYLIAGEQVISGMGKKEIVVPDATVYFVGGKPKKLAAGLSSTSQGVGVKLYGQNPMATVTEMRDAAKSWLEKQGLWSREINFWTPERFNESEYGQEQIRAWGPDYALQNGFVIEAEGTRFAHALAYGNQRGATSVYKGWEKLLERNGWWWRPLAVWAIYVYPADVILRGNPARPLVFHSRRPQNPIPEGQREKTRKATKRFEKKLVSALKNETWSMSIRDSMPKYTVVVYVEDCPGRGHFDRRQADVLRAFEESGLGKHLYFDGTDYGPLPGPKATRASVAAMGCPERGYHFYDAGPDHPSGVHTNTPGYREAAAWERGAIEQSLARAANKNPREKKASKLEPGDVLYTREGLLEVKRVSPLKRGLVRVAFANSHRILIVQGQHPVNTLPETNPAPERHREAFADYVRSADAHLDAGIRLLERGDRRKASAALRHAECDIRQAYTEARYGKRDRAELEQMTGQVTMLHDRLQQQVARIEAGT